MGKSRRSKPQKQDPKNIKPKQPINPPNAIQHPVNQNIKRSSTPKRKSTTKPVPFGLISSLIFSICIYFIIEADFPILKNSLLSASASSGQLAPFFQNYFTLFIDSPRFSCTILITFLSILYSFYTEMKCEQEITILFCLIIIADHHFYSKLMSSNFLIFHSILYLFTYKMLLHSFSFKQKKMPDLNMCANLVGIGFLTALNISLRIESISIVLVSIVIIAMKAMKRKKQLNKRSIIIISLILGSDIVFLFLFWLIFDLPHNFVYKPFTFYHFMDDMKYYSFSVIFLILYVASIILVFVKDLKFNQKCVFASSAVCILFNVFWPFEYDDTSMQFRIYDIQLVLFGCIGCILCKPRYFILTGTFLLIVLCASWILRYNYCPEI